MCHLILILSLSALGATDSGPSEQRPTEIFTIREKQGPREVEKVYYGWERQRESNPTIVMIDLDTPWDPRTVSVRRNSIVKRITEGESQRERRIREGYEERGLELVTTPQGTIPMPKAEVELARKARAMAGEDAPASPLRLPDLLEKRAAQQPVAGNPAITNPELPASSQEAQKPSDGPGATATLLPEIVLVCVALVAVAVITKTLILPRRQ